MISCRLTRMKLMKVGREIEAEWMRSGEGGRGWRDTSKVVIKCCRKTLMMK